MMKVKTRYKMTELGEIPNDWNIASIEDVGSTTSGGTPNRSNKSYYLDGNIPWIKTGELKNKYIESPKEFITEIAIKNSSAKMIEKNSVILAMYGATIGQVSILPFPATTNQACCAIISEEHVYFEFLYYYLKSKKSYLISLGAGGAQPNISQQIIRKIKIILPPLEEQQKIAEILSTVDEQIEYTDQLIEKTKELKKGLMQQLLTKGIGHTKFKKSELGEIPVEWEVKSLSSVLDIRDGTHDSPKYVQTGVPFLTSKNLGKGKLNFKEVNYITEEDHNKFSERSLVENGDILFGMIGTVGNPVIVNLPYSISIKNVALVKFHKSNMNNKYVLEYLNSQNTLEQFKKESNGGVQKFIALGKIRKLKITVPSVIEQQKIADILSSIDEEMEGYKQEKCQYEELKKGLMQQLLTGKTRVKVD